MKTAARLGALALMASATVAMADDAWTLTSADFTSNVVTPTAIDKDNVTFMTSTGVTKTLPWPSIIRMARPGQSAVPNGLVLCTASGERIVGTPVRMDTTNLFWRIDAGAEVPVAIDNVLGILRDRAKADALLQPRTEDQATLLTGDVVKGILTDVSPDAITFTPAAGDAVKVPAASVASIFFAAPPGGRKAAAGPAFLVRVGENVFACQAVRFNGQNLAITLAAGQDMAVNFADVQFIEHTGGPVAWLSSRIPTESIQTPYLDGDRPARMDQTVSGEPIRFAGVTYDRGIGVHSRSKLVFAVEPGDKTFRTRYAIDGTLTRADVDVRVLVDGKVVHEKIGFKAGAMSPAIEADLAGARTLTLEVDYGRGYDVQDRLNWIEPAIVRGP